jgi:hypothetical protein
LAARAAAVKALARRLRPCHGGAMERALAVVCLSLLATPAPADDWRAQRPEPKAGHSYPALYCMNRKERVELGETACVRTNCCPITGCEVFVARCELSTNNPTFRKVQDGCPAEGVTRREAPPASFPRAPG